MNLNRAKTLYLGSFSNSIFNFSNFLQKHISPMNSSNSAVSTPSPMNSYGLTLSFSDLRHFYLTISLGNITCLKSLNESAPVLDVSKCLINIFISNSVTIVSSGVFYDIYCLKNLTKSKVFKTPLSVLSNLVKHPYASISY